MLLEFVVMSTATPMSQSTYRYYQLKSQDLSSIEHSWYKLGHEGQKMRQRHK